MQFKNFALSLLFIVVLSSVSKADNLNFDPLVANPLEARVGTLFQNSDEKLRLDIGVSLDLLDLYSDSTQKLTFGSDFMVYTRLRSEGRLKFPVETSDYFFGVNFGYSSTENWGARVRIAHISSHLVDGWTNKDWDFISSPFVYSREFVDAILTYNFDLVRVYGGANFIFSKQPRKLNWFEPQIGFDFEYPISSKFSLLGGSDFKLLGFDGKYNPALASQLGVWYKSSDNKGLLISVYQYEGTSMHGMFYDKTDSYFGIGFQLFYK